MRKEYIPRAFQPLITNHIIDNPRCAIYATMGVGKTAPTLTAIDALCLAGEDAPTLIAGPKRVAERVWSREAAKWNHLRQVEVSPITGDVAERVQAAHRDVAVHTIGYHNLPWLIEYWGDRWPYKTFISDESTRLKNYRGSFRTSKTGKTFLQDAGGQRARALGRVAHTKLKRFVEITGTPSPNGLKDLWGQMWFLDAGQRLGRTFDSFKQRWFQRDYDGHTLLPLPFAQEQIQDRLRDICLTIDAADYFDVEKPIVNDIFVDLSPVARRHYKEMEDDMYTEFEGEEIEAFGAAARTQKCLQFANGAAYLGSADDPGERRWAAVHDEKLDALRSCMEEANGMPQIVVYEFKSDAARIRQTFTNNVVMLADSAGFDKFMKGKTPLGLAHPASLGHGVDGLQDVTNIITHFGHNWDLELYDQINGRIGPVRQAQSGFKRPVFINRIIARKTVDELVIARRDSKRTIQDLLLEAMKRRKEEQ